MIERSRVLQQADLEGQPVRGSVIEEAHKLLIWIDMNSMILDHHARLYEDARRRPEARAFSVNDLVRFTDQDGRVPSGAVLRVDSIDPDGKFVRLRRRSGETLEWTPTTSVQVFTPASGEVKRGTVVDWNVDRAELGVQSGDLGLVVDVHPRQGVRVRSKKLGDLHFDLEPGAWHYAVTKDGIIGHLRDAGELRLEGFRDVDPAPERPTHHRPFDEIGRAYSLLTHGVPPSVDVFSRGDLVYFAASRDHRIHDNYVYTIQEVRDGRLRLADGRELSGDPQVAPDVFWRPSIKDDIRLYTPAQAVASQDLIAWQRDDPKLLVRGGSYAEVLEVQPSGVVVTGLTSTPELLRVDPDRWAPRWHRENGTWHLSKIGGRELAREEERAVGPALSIA